MRPCLFRYGDHLQLHNKLSGFSKIASTSILNTKVLKLNMLLSIWLVRLKATEKIRKS